MKGERNPSFEECLLAAARRRVRPVPGRRAGGRGMGARADPGRGWPEQRWGASQGGAAGAGAARKSSSRQPGKSACGGARAGARAGAGAGRPRCARMARVASDSPRKAMTRRRPPQRVQRRTSTANTLQERGPVEAARQDGGGDARRGGRGRDGVAAAAGSSFQHREPAVLPEVPIEGDGVLDPEPLHHDEGQGVAERIRLVLVRPKQVGRLLLIARAHAVDVAETVVELVEDPHSELPTIASAIRQKEITSRAMPTKNFPHSLVWLTSI